MDRGGVGAEGKGGGVVAIQCHMIFLDRKILNPGSI